MRRLALALAIFLLAACGPESGLKENFLPKYDAFMQIYQVGTADEAERAMVRQLQLIDRAEAEKISGLEFAKLRFVARLRLSRVRDVMGKNDESERDMAAAVALYRASFPHLKDKTDPALKAELTELAESLEKENPPAWKKR
jgi:hypothetical protein